MVHKSKLFECIYDLFSRVCTHVPGGPRDVTYKEFFLPVTSVRNGDRESSSPVSREEQRSKMVADPQKVTCEMRGASRWDPVSPRFRLDDQSTSITLSSHRHASGVIDDTASNFSLEIKSHYRFILLCAQTFQMTMCSNSLLVGTKWISFLVAMECRTMSLNFRLDLGKDLWISLSNGNLVLYRSKPEMAPSCDLWPVFNQSSTPKMERDMRAITLVEVVQCLFRKQRLTTIVAFARG